MTRSERRERKKRLAENIAAARELAARMEIKAPPPKPEGPSVWDSLSYDEKSGRWTSPFDRSDADEWRRYEHQSQRTE